jgi:RNA polymerase sigma factor (sigma-70 family)
VKKNCPPVIERAEEAMRRLPPLERDVLGLSAGEGMLNDEIAARLGITPEAVERILAMALVRLDRILEQQGRRWWRFW